MVRLKRLNPNDNVKPFDCGDEDLNGFLLEDNTSVPNAKHHTNELLAVTYIIEDEVKEQTNAYFSLLNDKIDREITDNNVWNRLQEKSLTLNDVNHNQQLRLDVWLFRMPIRGKVGALELSVF